MNVSSIKSISYTTPKVSNRIISFVSGSASFEETSKKTVNGVVYEQALIWRTTSISDAMAVAFDLRIATEIIFTEVNGRVGKMTAHGATFAPEVKNLTGEKPGDYNGSEVVLKFQNVNTAFCPF